MSEVVGHETADFDVSLLPRQFQFLIRAIGVSATERLLESRGGTRIKRPCSELSWDNLTALLGSRELAESLWLAFPYQDHIDLPISKKIYAARRNARIRAAKNAGLNAHEVALRYGITAAYVRMLWR